MKKILILAIVVIAAWQAREHWKELVERKPKHEVVVKNDSGRIVESLRVIAGRQTFVKERLGPHEQVSFKFLVDSDASFTLIWQWSDSPVESRWTGGYVPAGPLVQRHRIDIHEDGSVFYLSHSISGR